MLQTEIVPGTTIVSATVEGGISGQDIEAFREPVAAMAHEGSQPSLLLTYGDVDAGEVSPQAMWEDLKASKILNDLEKVAIVTDKGWLDKVGGIAGAMSPVTLEVFEPSQRDEAVAWLSGSESHETTGG